MTKSRAVRLLLVLSFVPATVRCISNLPVQNDGGPGTATHMDSSVCSLRGATGAVGVVGCPCSTPNALACSGNDSQEEIICSPKGVWQGNGGCASGERCATSGESVGTCAKVVSVCADASPAAKVCGRVTECPEAGIVDAAAPDGGCSVTQAVFVCGPDLVTTPVVESCGVFGCTHGACTEKCTPGASACSGVTVNVCTAKGDTFTDITCPGECVSNRCLASWSSDPDAVGIVADDAYVFWVDGIDQFQFGGMSQAPASVWRAALTGSAAVSIYTAPPSGGFLSVSLDPTNVYFTEEDPTDGGESFSVLEMARSGGAPTTLATSATVPIGLGTDSHYVYWAEGPSVMRAAVGMPGSASTVAMGMEIAAMVVDPTTSNIYWIDTGPPMAAIVQAAPSMGMPVTLATATDPEALAVYEGTVYWTTSDKDGSTGSGSVYSWSAGGKIATLATDMSLPFDSPGIAANATTVAWITRAGLVSMPLAGGATLRTAIGVRPTAVALGDTFLVWSDSSSWASEDLGIFGEAPP